MRDRDELWARKWIARPVAVLFPKQKREEWLGDLHEIIDRWQRKYQYPIWFINLMIIVKTFVLILSAIEIRIVDLFIAVKKINK